MIARALSAAALLLLFLSGTATAQKMCDQVRTNITAAPAAISEKVPGIPNKRIYLCGYMIVRSGSAAGQDLQFEISSGTGTNCSVGKAIILPKMSLPSSGELVNRIAYTAEKTPPGHSICLEVFGSGTSLVSSFYWTQF
jgi:hypothetical protein